jgi:zinc protease
MTKSHHPPRSPRRSQSPIDRRERPKVRPLASFRLPEIHRHRLPNGLEVLLVYRPDLALVTSSIILHCGSVAEPPGLPGIASMVADLLDTGTSRRDALSISAELERLGSSLKCRSGYDGTSLGLNSLVRNAVPSMEILAEILGGAAFLPAELERMRNQRLTAILQQKDRPAAIASLALYRLLHGSDHPYGNDTAGTEESVKRMTREDCVRFFTEQYHPAGSTMIVVGNLRPEDAGGWLEGLAKSWLGEATMRRPDAPVPDNAPQTLLVDRPDAPQSEIRIGCVGIKRKDPDFFPSLVLNRILGGQFSSRMNANLREKRGFTYGAWSSFSYGKQRGPFVAGSAVRTQNTGEAVGEMLKEIESIQREGITGEELGFAREGIEGGFALAFESPGQVISVLQNLVLYDLPDDYYAKYLDNVRGVTREDVLRVAQRTLDTRAMSVVVVGDAATVRAQLESAGKQEIRTARVGELGL